MEVLLLFFLRLILYTLNLSHNELQEQNHLQEENKEQTSEIGFHPSENCMYSPSVSASCYNVKSRSCCFTLSKSYSTLSHGYTLLSVTCRRLCAVSRSHNCDLYSLIDHRLWPLYCNNCFMMFMCFICFTFVCYTTLSQAM